MQSRIPNLPAIFLAASALGALSGAGGAAAQERPITIGVVNLDYVVAQSPAGKELQAKLEKFQQESRAEVESRIEEARSIRQLMADGANSLSEDKLTELQQEWEDSQLAIRRLQDDKQRAGRKMQEEGLKVIEKQLEPVFERVRDAGGYDLILNNVPGVVVMVGERVEITQKVLDAMNAGGGTGS